MNDDVRASIQQIEDNGRRWSLAELTEATGVSARTVRFYIGEGLLPPPANQGPKAAYSRIHLDRLKLIERLKASYLPLKEIRRQLDELGDAEIHRMASAAEAESSEAPQPKRVAPRDDAAAYISRLLHRTAPPAPAARLPAAPAQAPELRESSSSPVYETEPPAWRKVPLSDGAELLIRDDLYQRKRDRVNWLVSWARKVFN
jgi:DNA-binding transcriptional MerR regulator